MKNWASHPATPIENAIARMPIEIGRIDAITLPNAKSSSTRERGRTRASASRASAALAIRRSAFRGASPVQPSQMSGYFFLSWAASSAVRWRSRGSSDSTGAEPASRPTMTRQPPSLPTNKGLFVSSEDSAPATPGRLRMPPTMASSAARPSRVRGPGMPCATRRTRSVKGDRNRSSSSVLTDEAWRAGMRAATSSRFSTLREIGMTTAARTHQAATITQR